MYDMVILKSNIQTDGNSYKMRVRKALVDGGIVSPGEEYRTILVSPNLDEEQAKSLDRIVNQLGMLMVTEDLQPEELKIQVPEEEGNGHRVVRPRPATKLADHLAVCPLDEYEGSNTKYNPRIFDQSPRSQNTA